MKRIIRFIKIGVLLIFVFSIPLSAQKNTEKYRKNTKEGWQTNISALLGLARGNTDYAQVETGFRTDFVTGPLHTFLTGNFEFKEGREELLVDKGFAHLRSIYSIDSIFEIEAFVQKEYNEFLQLKNRDLGGAALRLNIVDAEFDSLSYLAISLGAGAMFEHELVSASPDVSFDLFRSTNYFTVKWKSGPVAELSWVAYYQPDIANFNDFRFLGEGTLKLDITRHFAFVTTLLYRYDSEPFGDLENYDLELKNGITVTF